MKQKCACALYKVFYLLKVYNISALDGKDLHLFNSRVFEILHVNYYRISYLGINYLF